MNVKCSGVRRAGGRPTWRGQRGCVLGVMCPGWGVMEQGEISCISIGRWDAEETPMRVLSQGGSRPSTAERKAERAAEANGDRPRGGAAREQLWECGTSRLTDLGFAQLLLPNSKGQNTKHRHAPFPPNMLQSVHTHLCVCKDPPYSTGWAHALLCTPLPELASQLSGLHWTWGSPPAPSSMSPSSAPSQDKATLASPCCSTQEVRGTKGCTQLGCSLPHSSCCCQPPMEPPGLLLACQRQNHRGPLGEAGDSLVTPVSLGGLS